MLTVAEIRNYLGLLEYKPGWCFTAYEGAFEGPHIVIQAKMPNAYHPDEDIILDIHSPLPPMADVEQLHRWLVWRLCRIESHEAREWLRKDGRPLFDPHGPGADRDLW